METNETRQSLNSALVDNYKCFNEERFYLDDFDESKGMCSIVASSISDACPIELCRKIARFCKKFIAKNGNINKFNHIYVTAYAFPVDRL